MIVDFEYLYSQVMPDVWWDLYDEFIYKFPTECASLRILKFGQ